VSFRLQKIRFIVLSRLRSIILKLLCFLYINIILFCFDSYANEREEVIIHYQVRPPYFIVDENTKNLKDGTLFKRLNKIFEGLNIKYEFHELPAVRTQLLIKENKINICSGYAILTTTRKDYGVFSVPFYQDKPYVLVIRKNDSRFDKYSTLNETMLDYNLIMLIKFKFSYGKYVDELLTKNKKYSIDSNNNIDDDKKNLWKKYDIIDLDCFRIIDKINDKNKEVVNSKSKPNILLVNTDFLRAIDKANENDDLDYYALDYDRIAYLTLDECHGISANNLYSIFKKIKYENKKHIIGFSATVLRDGAEKKLVDIFSSTLNKNEKDKKLNIISRYDFMDAIRDNIIVPPYYTIMEVNKTVKNKIGNSNKKIIEDVLKELFEKLPYKKIICCCRTIQQMKDYYDFFKDIFKEYKIYCSSSHDDILKDKYNIADKEFFDSDGMAIMICVNRFREGSDIKKLDMGVYLDRVKKRTILVAMQTSGRVLRVDKAGKKTHGHIVDCLINDNTEKIEMLTAQLILSYYNKILSLSDENVENKKNLDNYKLLLTKIKDSEYNEKEKVLTVPLDDNKEMKIKLKLTTKSFDWKYLKNILIEDLNKKYDISKEEKFKLIVAKLKKRKQFTPECDFWEVYKNLNKEKYDLPENLYEDYKEFFDEKTWFEWLELKCDYYPYKDFTFILRKKERGLNIVNNIEQMKILNKQDKKIPINAKYYYKELCNKNQ